jgi:hypothetical protein
MRAVAPQPGSRKPAQDLPRPAHDPVKPAPAVCAEPAADAVVPAPAEPPWAAVVATTIKLWVARRLRSAGFVRRHWRPAAFALALVLAAAAVLPFTGVFAGTAAPGARVPAAGRSPAGGAGSAGDRGTSAQPAATAAQSEAAAWIAGQVSSDAIIACDPVMCAALQAQGVTAGRLMPLPAGTADPRGADVVVTSYPASGRLADEYAPAVIASFGSGGARIDVRATEPGGRAAYESALRADLAARQSAGAQLLRNGRILFTAREVAQLRAGEVDSRLLATLAALSSQYSFHVTGFGDSAPGVPVLFRQVTITIGENGAAELTAALALVLAQHPPYLPAHAAIVRLTTGQAALSIQFGAPSPLGLLTTVLTADLRRAPAQPAVIAFDQ